MAPVSADGALRSILACKATDSGQRNAGLVDELSRLLDAEPNWLAEILEYGLQAGKHDEFHEISKHLGLEKRQCIQFFVTNLRSCAPEVFLHLVKSIENAVDRGD